MSIVLYIISLFSLGFIAQRFIRSSASTIKWLNIFIIYVAMPAIILLKVPQLVFSYEMAIPVGFAWLWVLIAIGIVLALSRILAWSKPITGAVLLLVSLGNTSFVGLPMVMSFFNDAVLSYAVLYDQLGSFVLLNTFGVIVIASYAQGESNQALNAFGMIKKIISFPPFIALIIAISLPVDGIVDTLRPALGLIVLFLMPAALITLGLQFQPKILPEHRLPVAITITLKMLISPVIAIVYLNAINATGDVRIATIFEAAMPSMMTPGLLAIHAGISPRFIATYLGYSTVFAFISLPVTAWLLGAF